MQLGQDLYANTTAGGHRNHYGLMLGFGRASGDVNGYALGMRENTVGTLAINAYSLGGYWSHIGPTGWYTDAVVQGSTLTLDPRSSRGVGATTHGSAVSASLEAGLPIPLGRVTVEAQAQLVWQHLSVNDLDDGISSVAFRNANGWLGRLGVRVETQLQHGGVTWLPYLRANVLKSFGGTDQTVFAGTDAVGTSVASTAAQLGLGVAARMNRSLSACTPPPPIPPISIPPRATA
ncbi:autotransporter domain-containing protein [Cupriavidus necator]|uniref:autotransporter domain-containing protein n=1 Tax=Cupriavidus necator TaxID=106590 RepID=UPI001F3EA9AC|nr:autotransporter outer membrane beta-barrel domain-containing protein [Cupriavidus necator]